MSHVKRFAYNDSDGISNFDYVRAGSRNLRDLNMLKSEIEQMFAEIAKDSCETKVKIKTLETFLHQLAIIRNDLSKSETDVKRLIDLLQDEIERSEHEINS